MHMKQTEGVDCLQLENMEGGCEGVIATGLDPPSRGWGLVQEGALTMLTSYSWQVRVQTEVIVPPPLGVKVASAKARASSPLGGGDRGALRRARDRRWTAGRRTWYTKKGREKMETSS